MEKIKQKLLKLFKALRGAHSKYIWCWKKALKWIKNAAIGKGGNWKSPTPRQIRTHEHQVSRPTHRPLPKENFLEDDTCSSSSLAWNKSRWSFWGCVILVLVIINRNEDYYIDSWIMSKWLVVIMYLKQILCFWLASCTPLA